MIVIDIGNSDTVIGIYKKKNYIVPIEQKLKIKILKKIFFNFLKKI